jgi:beta-galactosidase
VEILSTDPTLLGVAPPKPQLSFTAAVRPAELAQVMPVLTPRPASGITDLSGTWKFAAAAKAGFESAAAHDDWVDIGVPGEWVMQGHSVAPDTAAAYFRSFELAETPAGQLTKLRFAAVHSLCQVFVNGLKVGEHEGGFVPFECDISAAVKPGRNTLASGSSRNR